MKPDEVDRAGGIVINNNGEILLITSNKHKITFPKGRLEPGEDYEQTAIREIKEEGGITNVTLVKNIGVLTRPGFKDTDTDVPSIIKNIHMYLATSTDRILQPDVNDVIAAHWVKIEDVEKTLSWPQESEFFAQFKNELNLFRTS